LFCFRLATTLKLDVIFREIGITITALKVTLALFLGVFTAAIDALHFSIFPSLFYVILMCILPQVLQCVKPFLEDGQDKNMRQPTREFR
jgi:hypothetical protein